MLNADDMKKLIQGGWLSAATVSYIARALCPYKDENQEQMQMRWMDGFNAAYIHDMMQFSDMDVSFFEDPLFLEGWSTCERCLTAETAGSFEAETVAVVSLYHISEADLTLLQAMTEGSPSITRKDPILNGLDSHYGVYVHTAMDRPGELDMALGKAVSQGLTAEAAAIIRDVADEGFTWVRFCRVGTKYEQYKTFSWG